MSDLTTWLKSGKYLPEFIRDFHDQKDLFKAMHMLYDKGDGPHKDMPSWVIGHQYIIDWFLWYMAGRGYTLQKSRTKLEYFEFEKWRDLIKSEGEA